MKRPFVLGLAALTALVALPFVPAVASAAPSPRDTRIVFSRRGVGSHDIYSMTSIGTNVVAPLNPAGVEDLSPVVSPDGKQIALTRYGAGPDELWVMNADGSWPLQELVGQGLSGWFRPGVPLIDRWRIATMDGGQARPLGASATCWASRSRS